MIPQSAAFDIATAALDIPVPIAYGRVRGTWNLAAQVEKSDKTRVAMGLLAEGPWDSVERIWINNKLIALPDTTKVHFHPGGDGEIGSGMTASSTGGDQKVDAFWSDFPGGIDYISYSRYAYLALKVPPDPGAPSADLTMLADFKALKVRQFDNTGAQTAFAWSDNWVWCIVDAFIRRFIKREQRLRHDWAEPLTTAEKARFDWALIKDAADHADYDIGAGVKRWSGIGIVWVQDGLMFDASLEQMLQLCRSYILEVDGKISVNQLKDSASAFTFKLDHVLPGSFVVREASSVRFNEIAPGFLDYALAGGSSDDATRFQIATPPPMRHEAHQVRSGFTARGMARRPLVLHIGLDYGANEAARVWRNARSLLLEELGDEPDPGNAYHLPFVAEWDGTPDTVKVLPGDVVTIDQSVSEEWAGTKWRVGSVRERADGTRQFAARQHNSNAYPDTAPAQQASQAPAPGTGLAPPLGVDASGVQRVLAGRFAESAPGLVTAQNTLAQNTDVPTTGAWYVMATVDFDPALAVASLTIKLTLSTSGSGAIRPRVSGGNIGASIHSGSPPATPQQTRTGTGDVTLSSPVGNKLTIYVWAEAGSFADITAKASQDLITPMRSGTVV